MKKIVFVSIVLGISFVFMPSCGSTKLIPNCTSDAEISYADVKPIIDTKCVKCHDESKEKLYGNFKTYEGLKPYLDNGRFAKLVLENQRMPKGDNLTQKEINLIQCWKLGNYKK